MQTFHLYLTELWAVAIELFFPALHSYVVEGRNFLLPHPLHTHTHINSIINILENYLSKTKIQIRKVKYCE